MAGEDSTRQPGGGAAENAACQAACHRIRLLIPWYAANPGAMQPAEREQVQAHVRCCETCSQRLAFVTHLAKEPASADWHPEAESLTRYVDAPDRLDTMARRRLEEHLASCSACADSVEALRGVVQRNTPLESPRTVTAEPSRSLRADTAPGFWTRSWRILAGGLLRPIPAAAYLVAAVAAGGLLITTQTTDRAGSGGGAGPSADATAWVGSPWILVDRSGADRSADGGSAHDDAGMVTVPTDTRQLLLVEFTNLMTPPFPETLYRVRIQRMGEDSVMWSRSVLGRAFASNYTLSIVLEPGILSPGIHRVTVTSPEGDLLFGGEFVAE